MGPQTVTFGVIYLGRSFFFSFFPYLTTMICISFEQKSHLRFKLLIETGVWKWYSPGGGQRYSLGEGNGTVWDLPSGLFLSQLKD